MEITSFSGYLEMYGGDTGHNTNNNYNNNNNNNNNNFKYKYFEKKDIELEQEKEKENEQEFEIEELEEKEEEYYNEYYQPTTTTKISIFDRLYKEGLEIMHEKQRLSTIHLNKKNRPKYNNNNNINNNYNINNNKKFNNIFDKLYIQGMESIDKKQINHSKVLNVKDPELRDKPEISEYAKNMQAPPLLNRLCERNPPRHLDYVKRQVEENRYLECTFQPNVNVNVNNTTTTTTTSENDINNNNNNNNNNNVKNNEKVYQHLFEDAKLREENLQKTKDFYKLKEMEPCTFEPIISEKANSLKNRHSDQNEFFDWLHSTYKKSQEKLDIMRHNLYDKNNTTFSFHPSINNNNNNNSNLEVNEINVSERLYNSALNNLKKHDEKVNESIQYFDDMSSTKYTLNKSEKLVLHAKETQIQQLFFGLGGGKDNFIDPIIAATKAMSLEYDENVIIPLVDELVAIGIKSNSITYQNFKEIVIKSLKL
jgi:hypothetical protein